MMLFVTFLLAAIGLLVFGLFGVRSGAPLMLGGTINPYLPQDLLVRGAVGQAAFVGGVLVLFSPLLGLIAGMAYWLVRDGAEYARFVQTVESKQA
jgi:hypothetical protein